MTYLKKKIVKQVCPTLEQKVVIGGQLFGSVENQRVENERLTV